MLQVKSHKNWLFPCLVVLIALGIEILGDFGRTQFSYQNSFVQDNEYWRAVTGHFTHLGWPHFLLNIAGLILVWFLYGKVFRPRVWALIFLWCCVSISLGFYVFDPELQSYVGLSGVLHGFIAAALLSTFWWSLSNKSQTAPLKTISWKTISWKIIPREDILIFVGLWGKVIYEQFVGPVSFTQSVSGGHVVVNAHFYGTLSGSIIACIVVFYKGKQIKRSKEENFP